MTIADLHCHYPMRVLAEDREAQERLPPRKRANPDLTLEHMVRVRGRSKRLNRLRAAVLMLAARLLNFRRFGGTWRVSLDRLEAGDVRVVLSVLYLPFAEMDLDEWFRAKPDDTYFRQLTDHIDAVEADLEAKDESGARKVVVKTSADLKRAKDEGKVAMVHCVEGGFHLGPHQELIEERVAELARRGVAYITLAHLFWRKVATNAPALPFLPDWGYNAIFCQPRGEGLSPLGKEIVRAMYRHRVLIDLSHMSRPALEETFDLLGRLDRESDNADPRDYPVLATHAGFKFGHQDYMLEPDTIERIHGRGGVIGLIMARHQLYSGLGWRCRRTFPRTVGAIRSHIDAIHEVTKDYETVAIGSDLDGFIKPTAGGIENVDDLRLLEPELRKRYRGDADAILHENARRVLAKAFAGRGA